jgi:hypothetical protein
VLVVVLVVRGRVEAGSEKYGDREPERTGKHNTDNTTQQQSTKPNGPSEVSYRDHGCS